MGVRREADGRLTNCSGWADGEEQWRGGEKKEREKRRGKKHERENAPSELAGGVVGLGSEKENLTRHYSTSIG